MNIKSILPIILLVNALAISYYIWMRLDKQKAAPSVASPTSDINPMVVPLEVVPPQELAQESVGDALEAEIDIGKEYPHSEEVSDVPYYSRPEVRQAWVGRSEEVVLKGLPANLDDAVFRNQYFHRGFTNRAATCGEVELLSGDLVVEEFQRFIYVGKYIVYYENKIDNFDILWDKLCVQTLND